MNYVARHINKVASSSLINETPSILEDLREDEEAGFGTLAPRSARLAEEDEEKGFAAF